MNRSGVQLLFLFCLLWHPRVSGLRRENSFPNDGTDKRDVLLDNSENSEMGSSQLCDCCNITVVLMEERDKLDSLQQLVAHNFNLIFRQSPQFHQIFFRTVTWESFSESEMLQNPLKVTQEKVVINNTIDKTAFQSRVLITQVCREIMGGTSAVVLIHERPEIASVSAIAYALSFYQIPVISTSARESEFSDRVRLV